MAVFVLTYSIIWCHLRTSSMQSVFCSYMLITVFEKKPERSQSVMSKMKENLIAGIVLGLLFGPGWEFGLASTSSDEKEVTFIFQLLFCVFAGSQGVLIFIVFGLCSKHFCQLWRKRMCFRSQTHAVIRTKQIKPQERLEEDSKERYTKTPDLLQPANNVTKSTVFENYSSDKGIEDMEDYTTDV